ncbi:MAG: response regulator [Deltaproteobacteria bacterium]|nr:response regulator [Deltaproteobacteria bacterium]
MKKVLIVDDERPILEILDLSLSSEGYEVLTAENGEKALEIFEKQRPKLVLTDIKMPGIDGIEVLQRIKKIDDQVEVIVITGHGDLNTAVAALKYGASDFVTKPLRDEVLMVAIERAWKKIAMSEQLQNYTKNLELKSEQYKRALQKAQDEMIKAERLASIGETVASLAHCLKNISTGLGGGMYMVHTGMAKEKPNMIEEGWSMFQRNLERVSDLVLDLLRYARQTEPQRTPCKLNDIVSEVMSIFKKYADDNRIKLNKVLAPNLTEVYIELDSIHRMLGHLVSNAIDACIYDADISKKWEVTVTTKTETDADSGEIILIEVTDNGCGMTDEIKSHLFHRFFTTKAGRGIGLGLLITQKIIRDHGGEVFIKSEFGKGTTVLVRLPAKVHEDYSQTFSDNGKTPTTNSEWK